MRSAGGRRSLGIGMAAAAIWIAAASPARAVSCTVGVDTGLTQDRLPSACAHFPVLGGDATGPIATGPDGRVWLVAGDSGTPSLVAADRAGAMQTVTLGAGEPPSAITGGPDGNVWYARAGAIGRVTPAGEVTEFPAPGIQPTGIVTGPDGALWFPGETGAGAFIGRITTGGSMSFGGLAGAGVTETHGITVGTDRALWIAAGARLARVSPDGGISSVAAGSGRRADGGVTTASDGSLWYSSRSGGVGRVSSSGSVSVFSLTASATDIVRGPGSSVLWATTGLGVFRISSQSFSSAGPPGARCGGQNPAACLTRFPAVALGASGQFNSRATPGALTVGRDGNVWYSEGPYLGRVLPFRGVFPCYARVSRSSGFGCGRTESKTAPVTQGGSAYLRSSCPRLTFRFCQGTVTLRVGRRVIASARYVLGGYDNPKVRVPLPRSFVRKLRSGARSVRATYVSRDQGGLTRTNSGTWKLRLG